MQNWLYWTNLSNVVLSRSAGPKNVAAYCHIVLARITELLSFLLKDHVHHQQERNHAVFAGHMLICTKQAVNISSCGSLCARIYRSFCLGHTVAIFLHHRSCLMTFSVLIAL